MPVKETNLIMKAKDFQSSFLSCPKDIEEILRKLFLSSKPFSDDLKRLLVINTKDCLDNKTEPLYNQKINAMSLAKLRQNGYIKLEPKIKIPEHEEVKSYIIISVDNFMPNANNPYYLDYTISFDIISNLDYWDIGNFRLRPLMIAGYIDGILNGSRLSGIGQLQKVTMKELILDENFAGYSLTYKAIHGSEDKKP